MPTNDTNQRCHSCGAVATYKGVAWFDHGGWNEGYGYVYLCDEHKIALDLVTEKYPDAEWWDIPPNEIVVMCEYWSVYPQKMEIPDNA